MSIKNEILEEFEKLKGQFILVNPYKIARLVAVAQDEFDYLWVTWDGRNLIFDSVLVGIGPLKGYLRDKDYKEMIRMAKLNHFDCVNKDKFNSFIEEKIAGYKGIEFITGLEWDMEKEQNEEKSICSCGAENSIRWDKHCIGIDDKQGSYKDLSFQFCEECGYVSNVDFS